MLTLTKGQSLSARFTLIKPLGLGGMGEVWLARDHELGHLVALKILSPDLATSPAYVELLQREWRNTRRLVHPNIVRGLDFHHAEGYHFFSMRYIEGEDFRRFRGRSYLEFLPALLPVLDALEYAHGLGIIHRDLKASNILLDSDGAPHLTDFGIAAAPEAADEAKTLRSGGSLYSMSPQQLDCEPPAPSDDIHALGVLLYELISGHPPFHPDITPEKVRSVTPPAPRADFPLPEPLSALVMRMLAKSPTERPSSIGEVRSILTHLMQGGDQATAPPLVTEPQPAPAAAGFDRIDPVSLRSAPTTTESPPAERPASKVSASLVYAALALLIGLAFAVIYLLPKAIDSPADRVTSTAAGAGAEAVAESPGGSRALAPEPGMAPWDRAKLAETKQAAELIIAEFLGKLADLEAQGVEQWAPDEYEAALAENEAGDALFRERDYDGSLATYRSALEQLNTLLERAGEVFSQAL